MEKMVGSVREIIPFRRGSRGGWYLDIQITPPEPNLHARRKAGRKQQCNAALLQARSEDNELITSSTTQGQGIAVKGWTAGTDDLICYYTASEDVESVHPVTRCDDFDFIDGSRVVVVEGVGVLQ